MRKLAMWKLTHAGLALVLAAFQATHALAASREDAEAAIARAAASAAEAASLKNQWTTTTQALNDARKAAGSGDADKALELAQKAEALAKASIAQSKAEAQAWKSAVIK